MNDIEYKYIMNLLDKYTLENKMMICSTQYNLINLDAFKKELKQLKEANPMKLDKGKINIR